MAERNRLALDLHDAVSQILFSTALVAEVLPRLWELNPIDGRRRLDEIRTLTRSALAEMCTLLLEHCAPLPWWKQSWGSLYNTRQLHSIVVLTFRLIYKW